MKLSLGFIAEKLRKRYDVTQVHFAGDAPSFDAARVLGARYAKRNPQDGLQPLFIANEASEFGPAHISGIVWLGNEEPPEGVSFVQIDGAPDPFEVLDCVLDILEEHAAWCEDVHDALLRKVPLVEIVQMLERVTRNPFWYSDAALRTLYISQDEDLAQRSYKWRHQTQTGRYPAEVLSQIVSSGDLERINANKRAWLFEDSKSYYIPFVSKSIICNGSIDGYIFIIESTEDSSLCDIELLEMFGNLIANYIEHSRLVTPSGNRFADQMLKDCLLGQLSNQVELEELASLLRWDVEERFIVAVFDACNALNSSKGTVESQMKMLEYNLPGHAIAFESNVVFVVNASRSKGADIEATLSTFCKRLGWKAGASNFFDGLGHIGDYYLQAKIALRLGCVAGSNGPVFLFRDYSINYICERLSREISQPLLIHQDVRRIADYDQETGGSLLETLDAYLANERSVSKTASSLFLHRNSVAYRIDKIRSLMHTDLDNDDNRLNMILSLKIWQYMHSN